MSWIKKLFGKEKTAEQCDIHVVSGSSTNKDHLENMQVLEDLRYYNNIQAEAMRQVNRPEGWLIDPSRANLMQIYTIYDEASNIYRKIINNKNKSNEKTY